MIRKNRIKSMKNNSSKKTKNIFLDIFIIFRNFIFLIFILNLFLILIFTIYRNVTDPEPLKNKHLEKAHSEYAWAKTYFEDQLKVKANYQSFVGFKEKQFNSETINIDEDGYRISRNNSKTPDVLFLGGSTMFGYGSNDENTIPSLFSKLTNDTLSVRNLGNGAHNSFQGFLKLNSEVIEGNIPKYLIVYEGVNEWTYLQEGMEGKLNHYYTNLFKRMINNKSFSSGPDDILSLKYLLNTQIVVLQSFINSFINKLTRRNYSCNDCIDDAQIEKASLITLNNWKNIQLISQENDIKVYFFLQPQIVSGNVKNISINPFLEEVYLKLYPKLLDKIENDKSFSDIKNSFFDLSKVLDHSQEIYFYDESHLNPKGNQKITNYIIKFIF